jgi:hypothetical protein
MLPTIICPGCDELLTEVSNTMRHHATVMRTAIELAKIGPTEEQRKDITNSLVASFNDAQAAWDAYRSHLIEHGVLPASPSPLDGA